MEQKQNKFLVKGWVEACELEAYLNHLLEIDQFKDYCPNGLQVQGVGRIKKMALAVTASLPILVAAKEWGADALLVHHGFFWKNEPSSIKGIKYHRLSMLIKHEMNLFAYHLPLDAHKIYGNNKQLGDVLDFPNSVSCFGGDFKLGWLSNLNERISIKSLKDKVSRYLGRSPVILGEKSRFVKRVAWCTGGAQHFFEEAINLGADVYLTGEASESSFHLAVESGVTFFSCGHYATECFGVQALGRHLNQIFGIKTHFFDSPNPI